MPDEVSSTCWACPRRVRRAAKTCGTRSSSSRIASPTTRISRLCPGRHPMASTPASSSCSTSDTPTRAQTSSAGLVEGTIGEDTFCDVEITPESEIMGLMRVLFLGGVEIHRRAHRVRVQAARGAPRPAPTAARRPVTHPGRRGGGRALVVAAPARWPHHLARGHPARRHDPQGRARGPRLRLRQPGRAPVRRRR